jgi:DUF1365 family protein
MIQVKDGAETGGVVRVRGGRGMDAVDGDVCFHGRVPSESAANETRSCLYECRILHHRMHPREHRFEYGIFLACFDLDELDELSGRMRWFSRNRFNLYQFRDSDHLRFSEMAGATGMEDVRGQLKLWLAQQGIELPSDARIRLVTFPRVLGYVFNPVSFYFIHNRDGTPLCSVAEVGNTFGEQKPYVVPIEKGGAAGEPDRFRVVVPKHFYVSPFSGLELCFDFRFKDPGEALAISVNDVDADGRPVLISALSGQRRPMTDGEWLRLTLKYPLVTLRVITLIHWHALRLWWKRIPWHRKDARPELQRGVLKARVSR